MVVLLMFLGSSHPSLVSPGLSFSFHFNCLLCFKRFVSRLLVHPLTCLFSGRFVFFLLLFFVFVVEGSISSHLSYCKNPLMYTINGIVSILGYYVGRTIVVIGDKYLLSERQVLKYNRMNQDC